MLTWLGGLFGTPWMLLWLPLAAAPILIHLWNRRKFRQMQWAAMEYLLAAILKSSKRMRIEQLLLLILRTLVIVLTVLAVAQPLIPSLAARLGGNVRTQHVFVLDGSYSMGYRQSGKPLFDAAKDRIHQIVDSANEGDAFTLILMSDSARAIVGNAAFHAGTFLREVDAVTLPDGGGNLAQALAAVENVASDVRKQHPELTRQRVYFLTDLGRTSWAAENRAGEIQKEFQQRSERLARGGGLEVVSIGAPETDNLAVTALRMTDSYATLLQPVVVQATIRNFGSKSHRAQPVELWVDDQKITQQTVNVPPGDAAPPVTFSHRFDTPGDHIVEVRAPGDPLEVDNRRFLAVPVKDHLRALCVSGKPGAAKGLAAALFGLIDVQVVPESALMELDLKRFDCVFLSNVSQFTASEARVLDSYLKSGGGLIFFLGDQVQADRYNRELGGEKPGSIHILPGLLGQTVTRDKYFFFDAIKFQHPLLAAWKGNPQTELLVSPVALKYFRLKVPEGSRARVALAFDSGDPAIVEEKVHRGRVILVATAESPSSVIDSESKRPWSLLSASGTLLPLVQELWRFSVSGHLEQRNVEVDQPLSGLLPALKPGASPTIKNPAGREEKVSASDEADSQRWTFGDTEQSGVYAVSLPGGDRPLKYAVNVDMREPHESDLARLSADDLPPGFTLLGTSHGASEASITLSGEPSAPAFDAQRPLGSIFDWLRWLVTARIGLLLLGVVVVALFVETTLAWWMGNRTA